MRYMTLAELYQRYGYDRRTRHAFWDGVLDGFDAMFNIDTAPSILRATCGVPTGAVSAMQGEFNDGRSVSGVVVAC